MKADKDDAPEWLRSDTRKRSSLTMLIPGLIGTGITLGALYFGGQALMKGTVQELAERRAPPKPTPVAEITRAEPAPKKDWDRIVEQQARRDAMSQQQPEQPTGSDSPAAKQNIFNDQNYIPRGADNILSSRESYTQVVQEQRKETPKITVIGEETKLKDFCGGREGSIERRNCRSQIGLNHRD